MGRGRDHDFKISGVSGPCRPSCEEVKKSDTLSCGGALGWEVADVQRGLEVTAPLQPITPHPCGCSLLMVLGNLLAPSRASAGRSASLHPVEHHL